MLALSKQASLKRQKKGEPWFGTLDCQLSNDMRIFDVVCGIVKGDDWAHFLLLPLRNCTETDSISPTSEEERIEVLASKFTSRQVMSSFSLI